MQSCPTLSVALCSLLIVSCILHTAIAAPLAPVLPQGAIASGCGAATTRCCPGPFTAKGHGGVWPGTSAFDYDLFNDGNRVAQRASDPSVHMGTLYLGGVGHFYWTSATDCKKVVPAQPRASFAIISPAPRCLSGAYRSDTCLFRISDLNFRSLRRVVFAAAGLKLERILLCWRRQHDVARSRGARHAAWRYLSPAMGESALARPSPLYGADLGVGLPSRPRAGLWSGIWRGGRRQQFHL